MKKITAIIISVAYLICVNVPERVSAALVRGEGKNVGFVESKNFPASIGKIYDSNLSVGERPDVVVICDRHCRAGVQKNIINILGYVNKNLEIGRIFSEGAPGGVVDLSAIRDIIPLNIKDKVLMRMVSVGLLSGGEYYAGVNERIELYGLEDWGLYVKNVKRFCLINGLQRRFLNEIKRANEDLDILKEEFYGIDMFIYDFLYCKDGNKDDKKYFNLLEGLCLSSGIDIRRKYPETAKLMEIGSYEEELSRNDIERDALYFINVLKEKVPFNIYRQIMEDCKDKTAEEYLILLYGNVKGYLCAGESSGYEYIERLKSRCKAVETFDIKEHLKEKEDLKEELFRVIFRDDITREISLYSRNLFLMRQYVKLEIKPEDLDELKRNAGFFNGKTDAGCVIRDKEEIADIFEEKEIKSYYDDNILRNDIFVKEFKRNKSKSKTDIIIVGGFHKGIASLLDADGFKYEVIMPSASEGGKDSYKEIMIESGYGYDALSDGLLVLGTSKYKQEEFLLSWIEELRKTGFKDEDIIRIINAWANKHKEFFGIKEAEREEGFDGGIDLRETVLETNKLSVRGWILKIKKGVKSYLHKFKEPFTYRYEGRNENNLDPKTIKRMESNVRFFPFIQLMLGFDLYSSFSTLFMQSNGYTLSFISIVMSFLAPVSFLTSAVSGVIGDKISKRTLLIISLVFHALGTVCFALSGLSPVLLIASQILPAVGISGLMVSLSPFLYGSLEKLGEKESFKERYGSNLALFWIIMGVSSIAGGTIAFLTSRTFVISIAAALDIIVLFGAFVFTHKVNNEILKETKKTGPRKTIKSYLKDLISPVIELSSNRETLSLAVINVIVNNIFFVTLCFFLQPLLSCAGLPASLLAPVYFAANVMQSLASHFIGKFGRFVEKKSARTIFFSAAGVTILLFILTGHPVFLVFAYITMNFWQGTSSLTEVSSVYKVLGDNMRSKWLAFKAMFGTITASAAQILIGCLLSSGISPNALIAASVSLITVSSLSVPLILQRRKRKSVIEENSVINIKGISSLLSAA